MVTLIKHFKSVKRMTAAPEEEIAKVVGPAKAKKITEFYKEKNK